LGNDCWFNRKAHRDIHKVHRVFL